MAEATTPTTINPPPTPAVGKPVAQPVLATIQEAPMVDTTTPPIPGAMDYHIHGYCGDDRRDDCRRDEYGRAADHLAFESMTTTKDAIAAVERHGNRLADGHNSIERSIESSKTAVSGLVTDGSFRALEQFGLAGVQAEKLSAATDVLVQKTTGELQTQITLTAKDSIIDAAKNAAASTLLAHQIAAAAAAKQAECCCEIKQKITEEACSTRALIAEIERRDADRREDALKTDLSNCRQTAEFARLLDDRLGCHGHGHSNCCQDQCCSTFKLPIQVVPCPCPEPR